jgi:predicted N-acetyltransferase YhbS
MYDFRPLEVNPSDIQNYTRLFSEVFSDPEKLSEEFLEWLYAKNPVGKALGINAWSGNELVAHYATVPVVYLINNEKIRGLLALNTATHPRHQGKGLFSRIGNAANDMASRQGYEFVIGVANQNSTYGYLKKLGFTLISPLDVKVGLGSVQTEDYEAVLKPFWDQKAFDWRLSHPLGRYFRQGAHVLAYTGNMGIKAILSLNTGQLSTTRLKKAAARVKLWIGINRKVRFKGAFMNMPERFKPSPLNLIFKDLSGKLPRLQKADVFFELIDFDAY